MSAPIDVLLGRLEHVRETGPGRWISKCPAHDDRSPSLSIRETDDGTLLIYDFAGCAPTDVLGAVGMDLRDLFPDSLLHRVPLRRNQRRVSAADALIAINHESLVIAIIASDFRQSQTIDEPTWDRLATAVARISEAREAAR